MTAHQSPWDILEESEKDLAHERELGRERMVALGLGEGVIKQLLEKAGQMHMSQLARLEREIQKKLTGRRTDH